MRLLLMTVLGLPFSCASAVAPTAPCAARDAISVCIDGQEFRLYSTIRFEIVNGTSEVVFEDTCARHLASRTDSSRPFDIRYKPSRNCGVDPSPELILEHRVRIGPGESIVDSILVGGFAIQGQYRIQVWLADTGGEFLPGVPFASAVFEIFPSAN